MSDGELRSRCRRDDRQAHRRRGWAARRDRARDRRRPGRRDHRRRPRSLGRRHRRRHAPSAVGSTRLLTSSVADEVRRESPIPVLVVPLPRGDRARSLSDSPVGVAPVSCDPSIAPCRGRPRRRSPAASTPAPCRRSAGPRGSGASRSRRRRTAARRHSTRSAGGSSSRNPQIVNASVRSWITGARPNSDARRNAMPRQPRTASSARSPGCEPQRRAEPIGELERVPLIGPLRPELRSARLRARRARPADRASSRPARDRASRTYAASRWAASGRTSVQPCRSLF